MSEEPRLSTLEEIAALCEQGYIIDGGSDYHKEKTITFEDMHKQIDKLLNNKDENNEH